jgi:DNA-binding winged helix-turn-helix (wHTH) protein
VPRYRFSDFILSPRRRLLLRGGVEQPLIPRYFDLLVFLVERRGDAVHRRDIFDAVWTDVVVSDSALSQAIRTIRRVLDDDSREQRFVRTVSRHGYQFVFADVLEEDDGTDWPGATLPPAVPPPALLQGEENQCEPATDPFAPLLERIARPAATSTDEEDQRDAAERLHALGTADALKRLAGAGGHAFARALLRDTRWDTPQAGPVPILGEPDALAAASHLVRLRLRRATGMVAARWASAAGGGAAAGAAGGCIGGLLLVAAPGNSSPLAVVPVLTAIGTVCGGVAGAGIGAGLAVAESVLRSWRTAGTIAGGAIGGGLVGFGIQLLGGWTLQILEGVSPPVGGGLEGFAIGGSAALGYALATRSSVGGVPSPRGRARWRVALITAMACGGGALAVSMAGRPLVGGTLHAIAHSSVDGPGLLGPLGRLIGEPGFGPVTAALIALGEGLTFGLGLALGLTRRR